MTFTELISGDWATRKSYGVVYSGLPKGWDTVIQPHPSTEGEPAWWIDLVLPLGKEKMTHQITVINCPTETSVFVPRTSLGEKLWNLRTRAIASGLRLLSEDEVLEEVKRRRRELENDETNIY